MPTILAVRKLRRRSSLACSGALAAILGASALAGCASTRDVIGHQEDLLAAAGFEVRPANTPARQEEIKALPPNKFVMRAKDDHVAYLYADPIVCNCLYVGDQKNYNNYKRYEFEHNIANQQELTAQLYQQSWDWRRWNWGPWGLQRRFFWW